MEQVIPGSVETEVPDWTGLVVEILESGVRNAHRAATDSGDPALALKWLNVADASTALLIGGDDE